MLCNCVFRMAESRTVHFNDFFSNESETEKLGPFTLTATTTVAEEPVN